MADREDKESVEDLDSLENGDLKSVSISQRAQGKTRVELSFTGTPGSTVGLNVFEYDGITQGLTNEITKERLLKYLTSYEQVPIVGMPVLPESANQESSQRIREVGQEGTTDPENQGTNAGLNGDRTDGNGNQEEGSQQSGNGDGVETRGVQDNSHKQAAKKNKHKHHNKGGHKHHGKDPHHIRAVVSEEEEEENILQERISYKVIYPIEKMIFGLSSSRLRPVEGDDAYLGSNMGALYGDAENRRPKSMYRRRALKASGQYEVAVDGNDYAVATSAPIVVKTSLALPPPQQPKPEDRREKDDDVEVSQHGETEESRARGPQYGTPQWYEKMNSKLSSFSLEAFTFMQSGLSIVSDFSSLRVPVDMRRENFTKVFAHYRKHSRSTDLESFTIRDEARQVLEQYVSESGLTMIPPPIMLDEQARLGYYRSLFFNTSRIESQGTGKVLVPRIKPYSTWLATGFSLNTKTGLSVAEPIRLPTNQGLFIVGNFPDQVQVGEQVLLTYGINNYLGKDLTNVLVRIRASKDFDLIEQNQPERIASSDGKDYTITLPSLKALGSEIRHIILVPKRAGVVKILLEVESEFGGDYEVLTALVRESGIERPLISGQLFDLTDKKSFGPIVEKIAPSASLRGVRMVISGTGLDRLVEPYTLETNALVGVDRGLIRLWNLVSLRQYLNASSQQESPLFDESTVNALTAYQKLQQYSLYDGSYSFISDQGEQIASLYLTTLAFGALISPHSPVSDTVTINRTLNWILSRQQPDGAFDHDGPCFHYKFCAGEFRREALTALVLYTATRHNVSTFVPEYVRRQLFQGEQSPILRAQRFLESRLEAAKSCVLTTTLIELALIQSPLLPENIKQKIYQNVRSRPLTVNPESNSRFVNIVPQQLAFDDQLLLNVLTLSIYAHIGDWKATYDIGRWAVEQMELHPHADSVLDGVFHTQAWLDSSFLFRLRFGSEKVSIVVDVSTDNGQKHQVKIDSSNFDFTQVLPFNLPVNQITYTVSGFGIATVYLRQFHLDQQQQTSQPAPFQLNNQFTPMPWLNEIQAKTCLTYSPTAKDLQLAKQTFNRTIVVEVQIPSGMRLNLRQIGFFLSRVPEAMYFTFNERANVINFFLNVPSTSHGKAICLDWCLERLSVVASWKPIQVRAYDYLQPEQVLARLIDIKFQPNLLGYSFVEAVHAARPTIEQLAKMQQQQMQQMQQQMQQQIQQQQNSQPTRN